MKNLKPALSAAATFALTMAFATAQAQTPVTVTAKDNLGSARYMDSTATWDPTTNQVKGQTHIYVHHALSGFTGGLSATLNDKDGHALAILPQISWGVDGTKVFWSHSSRTEHWSFAVSPNLASKVASITLINSLAPHNRMGAILKEIGDVFQEVTKILESQKTDQPGPDGSDDGSVSEAALAKLPKTSDLVTRISALETAKVTTTPVPPGNPHAASTHLRFPGR